MVTAGGPSSLNDSSNGLDYANIYHNNTSDQFDHNNANNVKKGGLFGDLVNTVLHLGSHSAGGSGSGSKNNSPSHAQSRHGMQQQNGYKNTDYLGSNHGEYYYSPNKQSQSGPNTFSSNNSSGPNTFSRFNSTESNNGADGYNANRDNNVWTNNGSNINTNMTNFNDNSNILNSSTINDTNHINLNNMSTGITQDNNTTTSYSYVGSDIDKNVLDPMNPSNNTWNMSNGTNDNSRSDTLNTGYSYRGEDLKSRKLALHISKLYRAKHNGLNNSSTIGGSNNNGLNSNMNGNMNNSSSIGGASSNTSNTPHMNSSYTGFLGANYFTTPTNSSNNTNNINGNMSNTNNANNFSNVNNTNNTNTSQNVPNQSPNSVDSFPSPTAAPTETSTATPMNFPSHDSYQQRPLPQPQQNSSPYRQQQSQQPQQMNASFASPKVDPVAASVPVQAESKTTESEANPVHIPPIPTSAASVATNSSFVPQAANTTKLQGSYSSTTQAPKVTPLHPAVPLKGFALPAKKNGPSAGSSYNDTITPDSYPDFVETLFDRQVSVSIIFSCFIL
jgi:hypothetical protein